MVPKIEKSAWFWVTGNNCPSAFVQPRGQKLPPNIMISPTKGSGAARAVDDIPQKITITMPCSMLFLFFMIDFSSSD
jgi:hypothetical protein